VGASVGGFERDVAGQHERDRRVAFERLGEGGVAGPEDLEWWAVDAELGAQGGGDGDLGEDPEALVGERVTDAASAASMLVVRLVSIARNRSSYQANFMNMRSTVSSG
jgi:hypothetical protein